MARRSVWSGVLLLSAACGSPAGNGSDATVVVPPGTYPGATALQMPATTLLPTTVVPALPFVSSEPPISSPAVVAEPCPESSPFTASGDGSGMLGEVGRLEPMIGRALAYGSDHPDEFGSYGLIWHAEDDASVFASFTGNLAEHRSALAGMVEHPDELIVCQVALSGAASQALSGHLTAELAGRFLSIGVGIGAVEIALPATEQALADDLTARYGDAVEITLLTPDQAIAQVDVAAVDADD